MAEIDRPSKRLWARLAPSVLGAVAASAIVAPWLSPYSPTEQHDILGGRLLPPLSRRYAIHVTDGWRLATAVERTPGGLAIEDTGGRRELTAETVLNLTPEGVADRRFFLLGTDRFSRDVFSRLLHGARTSLAIGLLATTLALALGLTVGGAAALGGRWLDSLLMRTVDGLLTFPWIFLLIALAAFTSPGRGLLIVLIGGTGWMGISRLARAELLALKNREFVLAARGFGATGSYLFRRHLLPNAMTPLLVDATLRVGGIILAEAALSFLGFGVQAPHPSWGNMIAEGRGMMFSAWWVSLFPGLALVATVLALSWTGDSLRDRLDPRTRMPSRPLAPTP